MGGIQPGLVIHMKAIVQPSKHKVTRSSSTGTHLHVNTHYTIIGYMYTLPIPPYTYHSLIAKDDGFVSLANTFVFNSCPTSPMRVMHFLCFSFLLGAPEGSGQEVVGIGEGPGGRSCCYWLGIQNKRLNSAQYHVNRTNNCQDTRKATSRKHYTDWTGKTTCQAYRIVAAINYQNQDRYDYPKLFQQQSF